MTARGYDPRQSPGLGYKRVVSCKESFHGTDVLAVSEHGAPGRRPNIHAQFVGRQTEDGLDTLPTRTLIIREDVHHGAVAGQDPYWIDPVGEQRRWIRASAFACFQSHGRRRWIRRPWKARRPAYGKRTSRAYQGMTETATSCSVPSNRRASSGTVDRKR